MYIEYIIEFPDSKTTKQNTNKINTTYQKQNTSQTSKICKNYTQPVLNKMYFFKFPHIMVLFFN